MQALREELTLGAHRANMAVASNLFRIATKKGGGPATVQAAIWWTKARMGWTRDPPHHRRRAGRSKRNVRDMTDEELIEIIHRTQASRPRGDSLRRQKSRGEIWLTGAGSAATSRPRHHLLICDELEALSRGDTDRLALFLPPGSRQDHLREDAVSALVSRPAPDPTVLATSHTYELAEHWGRRARNLVETHGKALGVEVDPQTRSAGLWLTLQGGQFFAAGVGGAIAGWRADLGLIDDPVRSREDAESKTRPAAEIGTGTSTISSRG